MCIRDRAVCRSNLAELARALDDLRHQPVADGLFGAHPEVALHVGEHFRQRLAGLLGDHLGDALARAQDFLRLDGDVGRRAQGAARKTCVPALATHPVPTVVTGARTKRMMSWIESPDSTCPPGDEISTVIGPSESSASAIRRVHVARATAWLLSLIH